ncbi:unnamed protein product [Trypanosoma brucei gambiense DAL972]|uniref:ADG2 n=1 Tax=Trypanosoma brucei gambiense (strain MHOM/CI/86/DAL972) TaxID=679716 RepID=C9ZPK8_TRYB9|nr:uncharacterized protein [Trypanosoma brucei gambiense DAL972]CBH11336.1 unnamed protein product [Trypanosoma brucei gambiense DAL972]|eukprot:XP_011773623.1 uncharacterized protein [Trypanosoma brucei gambiense DAL972]
MVRRDRDVWDPPEDRQNVPPPPSAFQLHFQNRAVIIGKDGSNAQLITAGPVKSLKVPPVAKNGPLAAGIIDQKHKAPEYMGGKPTIVGGIRAPDEVAKRPTRGQLHRPCPVVARQGAVLCKDRTVQRPLNHSADTVSSGALVGATAVQPSTCPSVEDNIMYEPMALPPRPQLLSLSNIPSCGGNGTADPLSSFIADRTSSDINPSPSRGPARPIADSLGVAQRPDLAPHPLTQVRPRIGNGYSTSLMPKPSKVAEVSPTPGDSPNRCGGISGQVENRQGGCGASPQSSEDGKQANALRGDAIVPPMYQPMGKLLQDMSENASYKHRKPFSSPARSTSASNPGGEDKMRVGDTPIHPKPQRAKEISGNDQHRRPASHPRRLQPLKQTPLNNSAYAVNSFTTTTNTDERGDTTGDGAEETEKKRTITYKPHGLKEYKALMEEVANRKLGSLGFVDTEERQEARRRMQRQREYGVQAEQHIIEDIREKQQRAQLQKQKSNNEEDGAQSAAATEATAVIRQPPPPERVQAQQRRARALEYARNLPRIVPATSKKPAGSSDSSPSEARRREYSSPRDEAARQRRQRILELEARHMMDRERITVVKRQLGFQ